MSHKSRRFRKTMIKSVVWIVVVISIIAVVSVVQSKVQTATNKDGYTQEELLHDHDGDGVPEH